MGDQSTWRRYHVREYGEEWLGWMRSWRQNKSHSGCQQVHNYYHLPLFSLFVTKATVDDAMHLFLCFIIDSQFLSFSLSFSLSINMYLSLSLSLSLYLSDRGYFSNNVSVFRHFSFSLFLYLLLCQHQHISIFISATYFSLRIFPFLSLLIKDEGCVEFPLHSTKNVRARGVSGHRCVGWGRGGDRDRLHEAGEGDGN